MPEALTESFCERCGTRYEFTAPTRLNTLRKTRGMIAGLKNYIMSQDALSDAVGDAMRSEEESLAARQLEAFHESFNFCIQCRQYTCLNCWNDSTGRCRTCVPIPGTDDLIERFETSFHAEHAGAPAPAAEMEQALINQRLGIEAWPSEDLTAAGANGRGPMAEAEPEAEPEPEPVVAEPVPEPVIAAEPQPVVAAEPEPALRLMWEADAPFELEPEPVVAAEPEPVVAEPEPVIAAEPQAEAEPVVAAEPEPVVTAEPEPVAAAEPEPVPQPEEEPVAAAEATPPQPPAPRPILPISETILQVPRYEPPPAVEQERVAAEAEDPALAARRAKLDLLGLGDPGQGPVTPARPNVLPYRSRGASVHPAEAAGGAAPGRYIAGSFWEASAREVAGAMTHVGIQACGQCGLSLSASARFCRRCGTRQARSA